MRKALSIISLVGAFTASALVPGVSMAAGCLKGAAVGGVAGHVAGGHAVIGAGAGCLIEHHREKKAAKAAAAQQKAAQTTAPAPAPAPGK